MQTLKQRLIEERTLRGWSQTDLANRAKIRQSFIGALEAKNQENSKYLPEIANALGVDAYWLKTGKGQKHQISEEQQTTVILTTDQLIEALAERLSDSPDYDLEYTVAKLKKLVGTAKDNQLITAEEINAAQKARVRSEYQESVRQMQDQPKRTTPSFKLFKDADKDAEEEKRRRVFNDPRVQAILKEIEQDK